jgi:peptidoglycan hydrolase-like protein with peptidoglycan-binding domain
MDCPKMNLHRGSTGPLVTIVEKYLHPLGLYPYKYDEIFGKGVYNGVVTRQKQLGLKPDGIFGPISCKAFGLQDPIPTPKPSNKPQLILDLQTALNGTINSVQDWINLLIKYGVYSHYDCMNYMTIATINKYGIKLAIQRIRNGGLNCADYVALTIKVFEALIQMGLNLPGK